MNTNTTNALSLERKLAWFDGVLEVRFSLFFGRDGAFESIYDIPAPGREGDDSEYARLVKAHEMTFEGRIVLMLALIPHVWPQAVEALLGRNPNLDRVYTEFGGWKGQTHGGFLPTCETAAFILAGPDVGKRLEIIRLFDDDHFFASKGILRIEHQSSGEPFFSGVLRISTDHLNRLT